MHVLEVAYSSITLRILGLKISLYAHVLVQFEMCVSTHVSNHNSEQRTINC